MFKRLPILTAILVWSVILTIAPASAQTSAAACSSSGTVLSGQALIVGVRVGTHDGYDRIVFDYASRNSPALAASTYEVSPATPPYRQDPRGNSLSVAGATVLKITLRGATFMKLDGTSSYAGSRDFVPGFPVLRELKFSGDFEAVSTWFVGLNGGSACAYTLSNSLVVDLTRPIPNLPSTSTN